MNLRKVYNRRKKLRWGWRAEIASARGDDEQAREWQQHRPVGLDAVGGGKQRAVLRQELGLLGGSERRQERPQRRTLEPFDDAIDAGERMVIGRAPDVDAAGQRPQQRVIPVRRSDWRARIGGRELRPPPPFPRDAADGDVARLGEIVRHLDR